MENQFDPKSCFEAMIHKIQTLRGGDGSYRVTLDIPLIHRDQIKSLMDISDTETVFVAILKKTQGGENGKG